MRACELEATRPAAVAGPANTHQETQTSTNVGVFESPHTHNESKEHNKMIHEERAFIAGLLAAGQKKDSIAHALLMRRALQEVEQVAKSVAYSEQQNRWILEQQFYTFLGPKPKPVKIKDEGGVELWQESNRQEYRVHCLDLPAFCKEMKLDLAAMTDVAQGARRDHRDWMVYWTGGQMDQGRAWVDPEPQRRETEAAKAVAKAQGPWKKTSAYTVSPPMIEWRPEAGAPSTGRSK